MSWHEKAPGTYENATEDNPHRFGVNAWRNGCMWQTNPARMAALMAGVAKSLPTIEEQTP